MSTYIPSDLLTPNNYYLQNIPNVYFDNDWDEPQAGIISSENDKYIFVKYFNTKSNILMSTPQATSKSDVRKYPFSVGDIVESKVFVNNNIDNKRKNSYFLNIDIGDKRKWIVKAIIGNNVSLIDFNNHILITSTRFDFLSHTREFKIESILKDI